MYKVTKELIEELKWNPARDLGSDVVVRLDKDDSKKWTYCFQDVPPLAVDARKRDAAKEALAYCRRQLGLPEITLRWFKAAREPFEDIAHTWKMCFPRPTKGKIAGCAIRPWEIRLNADYSPEEIRDTVAHECKHLAQPDWTDDDAVEEEATEYGLKTAENMARDRYIAGWTYAQARRW